MEEKKEDVVITEIIETGAEVGGGVSGALIGGLLAGPPGAILGGISGPILTKLFYKVGLEIKKRVYGSREESRIGYTYSVALSKIKTRIEAGHELRKDDFFELDDTNRSTAEEILEGVLRSAQTEFEEKKLPHYGNLLANISFNQNVGKDKAYLFLRIAQNLSYKQLCILQFLRIKGQVNVSWGYNFNRLEELADFGSIEPLVEELDKNKLLVVLRTSGLTIASMSISKLGKELSDLMELNEINQSEINLISEEFDKIREIISSNKK